MNLKNFKITNRGLYWGLILTFAILYLGVGFVSTLHSITFFHLANGMALAILLGLTYEVGQAAVLFSILMTKNKDRFLPWALMLLLTALQVTANVYASFKFMALSGSNDWTFWQKAILIGVNSPNPETYQIIISWIAGALLPIVALGMTALVAENMKMMNEESAAPEKIDMKISYEKPEEHLGLDVSEDVEQETMNKISEEMTKLNNINDIPIPPELKLNISTEMVKPQITVDLQQDNFMRDNRGHVDWGGTIAKSIPPISDVGIIQESPSITSNNPLNMTGTSIKKERELLQKEEIKVPKKHVRHANPLTKKSKIKNLKVKDLYKPSKGEEAIALIEKIQKLKDKESIKHNKESSPVSPESLLIPPELQTPYLQNGVEVIDAKAIQKEV